MAKDEPKVSSNAPPEELETDPDIEGEGEGEPGQGAGQEAQPPAEGQGQGAEQVDLGGFKSIPDLVKATREAHSTITKLSQRVADQDRFLEQLRFNQAQAREQVAPEPLDWRDPDKAASVAFQREIGRAIPIIVNQVMNMQTAQQLAAVRSEDPEEFDRLVPLMSKIIGQRPELDKNPMGAKILFEEAKKQSQKVIDFQDPDKLIEMIAPRLAAKFNITLEQAKQEVINDANARRAISGVGGGRSPGTPRKKSRDEEIMDEVESVG